MSALPLFPHPCACLGFAYSLRVRTKPHVNGLTSAPMPGCRSNTNAAQGATSEGYEETTLHRSGMVLNDDCFLLGQKPSKALCVPMELPVQSERRSRVSTGSGSFKKSPSHAAGSGSFKRSPRSMRAAPPAQVGILDFSDAMAFIDDEPELMRTFFRTLAADLVSHAPPPECHGSRDRLPLDMRARPSHRACESKSTRPCVAPTALADGPHDREIS